MATKQQLLAEQEAWLHHLISQLSATEERERRYLAAELHDYLAQLLTLARMKAHLIQISRTHEAAMRFGRETDQLLQQSLDYVRTLMTDLYPTQLETLALPAALRFLAGQMRRHSLTVDLALEREDLVLDKHHTRLLYQSVRELLMNVVKHAGVDRARVSLGVDSAHVVLTVEDQGKGFDFDVTQRDAGATKHFGLFSIQERMAVLGGAFSCTSAVGRGTMMILEMPLSSLPESQFLRAASAAQPDRVKPKPSGLPNQETLPL